MSTPARRVTLWAIVIAWATAIFLVSSVPGSELPGFLPPEVGHLGEYFVLGGLLYLALRVDLEPNRAWLLAVVIASAYGVTDEFHQRFVVMRTPDVYDWVLDTIAAFAGAWIALVVVRKLADRHRA